MRYLEILDNGTKVHTSREIRFTEDPLLLARFCRHAPDDTCLDIGCGCGMIVLWLYDRGLRGTSVAIDISEEAVALTKAGISDSGATCINAELADAREYSGGPFTLAVCNPPYFKNSSGAVSPSAYRSKARSDITLGLADMAKCAERNLREGGRLCFCIPPARYDDALEALRLYGFGISRMERVFGTGAADAPRLLLIEAVKGYDGLPVITENKEVMR